MASAFLSSILSKTSQVSRSVRRWAASPSSSSDPRSSILKDLKKLERTLERIQTVLHDAEERDIREEAVKLWLKELKEVAYDAEDVLDEYHYEELRAQVEARASRKRKRVEGDDEEEVSNSLSTIVVSIPVGMGDRIREIRERFDEISKDRERLRLREEDGERRVFGAVCPPSSSHMVDESSIYGREHDKQKVIDLLFSEGMGNGISVIPIVGKGGLGKTTIAQLVYNDSKVKERFDLTGWVCVSDDFNVPRLTKAIIESITEESRDLTELSPLQNSLKEKVEGRKVLLVLDDVWNEQQSRWESLRIPLVGAETVRIIMTCRNDSVAEIMQTVHPYHPGYLSEDDSWSLFEHYAFAGRESEEQSRLADIGKQIVEKCSGLPLAVKTMGSLLRHEIDEDSWMDVLQSDLWELDKDNETLASLRLSYNRMPPHLKPCFIYCSMFPKDYVFDRDVLVRLWMAQGYIPPQGNECYTIVDNWLSCFPDGVRHLCIQGQEELVKSLCSQNLRALRTFLLSAQCGCVYNMIKEVTHFPLLLLRTECLRTLKFVWKSEDELPDSISNLKHLRYLHITSKFVKRLPESVCLLYHLQTLILDCDGLAKLPDGLGNLINLRYFKLQTYWIKRLPESVCQLSNLQTLDLHWCKQLKELPSGIGSLTNLRYLDTVRAQSLCLPAGIKKLTNLQRLHGCYEVQGGIGVLKDLVNLQGDLCISGLRNLVSIGDAKDVGLKYKHKLEQLYLFWDANCENDWHYEGDNIGLHLKVFLEENKDVPADEKREEALLEYLQPPTNLKKLLISGYGGSKFPEWVGNLLSFASLKDIVIIDCEKIRSLPLYIHDSLGKLDASISKSMLERVSIYGCPKLTSIGGLHNLHSLKQLKISVCPQLLILSEEGLPSKLQKLHNEECQWLTSLSGMQNLTSFGALNIYNCLQLWLLSEQGLPFKLQYLHIEECQQLTSLPGMQHLASLRALTITKCPQLRLLSEEGLPSKLESLHIEKCQQLTLLSGMQNLTSLRALTIKNCPQLRLLSGEELPSSLQDLHIEECQQLMSLQGMQNLASLELLTITNCPQLQLLSEEGLPSKLQYLYIEECQQLTSLSGMQNLTSLGKLTIRNCPQLLLLSEEGLPSKLEKLYIEKCQQLTSLSGMQNLTSLIALTIKSCPKLRLLSVEDLPSILQDLHIEECQQLISLPGMQNLTSLGELTIINCPQLQLLSEEGLPTNLQDLHIEECQQLISLQGMQNLTSLEALTIINCPQLWLLSKEELPSKLQYLYIADYQQLTSLSGVQNLASLRALTITNCPQLRLLSEEELPFKLQRLFIEKCQQLTSLSGMQNLTSLDALTIQNCPKLQIIAEEQLSSMPKYVDIIDCPGLVKWCEVQKINCIQVVSGNKLTISNSWGKIMHGFDDLTSIEHLCFSNSWKLFLETISISILEELTIWGCTHVPSIRCLPEVTSLRSMVIKDCPGIQHMADQALPCTLDSLVVDSCEDLRCLQLALQNRDALKELQIVNCPKLTMVEGLNCIFFLRLLRIEQCPKIQLSPADLPPFNFPRVKIALVLQEKFNPPQSEEAENRETIDDKTLEKRVMRCVVIEHFNNAVSPILNAASDCNTGQILEGLPSSSTSQSLLEDKEIVAMMIGGMEDNDCHHDKNPL
ncbi:uncharacterized protein [Elaeis guineensis]|uniref:uncharacterized protein isoform X2 n=1 Tax=Elaeis guineensis var. tenera TaxID=51953 RepID=UPI003C6CF250